MKSLLWVAALFLAALSAVSTRAASVDGLNIQYSVAGNGQTIIFVHGWTCDDRSWSNQVSEFSKHYRVVTLELPGHGKSDAPAPEDFSMKLFAAAVEAVRAEISGADRVVLVGHSMGAVVIRQYALDYPERVAGLVAVDGELDVRPFANLKVPPMTQQRRVSAIEGMFVNETSEALRQKNSRHDAWSHGSDRGRSKCDDPRSDDPVRSENLCARIDSLGRKQSQRYRSDVEGNVTKLGRCTNSRDRAFRHDGKTPRI